MDISVATSTSTTLNSQHKQLQASSSRVVVELYSHLYPDFANTIRKFFTGEAIQNQKPAGFHSCLLNSLVHNQSITFTLIGPAFNCVDLVQKCIDIATIVSKQPNSEYQIPKPAQWTITVSPHRLKLGNLFEMKIYHGAPPVSPNPDVLDLNELVIGKILSKGSEDIFETINQLKVNTATNEPIVPVVVVQCGEL
jgi:hypothetical protein